MLMPKRDGYTFKRSSQKGKKYDAFKGGKKIASFGAKGYEHYDDRIGLYDHLDHKDPKRRAAYRKRHGGIKTKDGRVAVRIRESPAWFSQKYLW